MKILGFDIEISNVFDLRPGEDIDNHAPYDVAVAAVTSHARGPGSRSRASWRCLGESGR